MAFRCKQLLSFTFDILTIFITIADFTSDIIVTYDFYHKDRLVFAIISTIILVLAQISYSALFSIRCCDGNSAAICCCCCFACPFAPFLSFIIYLFSEHNGFCTRKCECLGDFFSLNEDFGFAHSSQEPITKFMMEKLNKHLGFIIEGFVEAFPQSLLQMIAIGMLFIIFVIQFIFRFSSTVYYNEANMVLIISVFLSIISVTSKGIVFSKGIEWKMFLFSWICICTDFFGIFFTLIWTFFDDNNQAFSNHSFNNNSIFPFMNSFTIIGQLWLYKYLFGILPAVLFVCLAYYIGSTVHYIRDLEWPLTCSESFIPVCKSLFIVSMTTFAFIFGTFVACIVGELVMFTMIVVILYYAGTDRFLYNPEKTTTDKLKKTLNFLSSAFNSNDCAIRMLCINQNYYSNTGVRTPHYDKPLMLWIASIEASGAYGTVSLADIRNNCNGTADESMKEYFPFISFWDGTTTKEGYKVCITDVNDWCLPFGYLSYFSIVIFCYVLVPIFLMSKLFQLMFPWIIVIYLFVTGVIFDEKLPIFQLCLLSIYCVMQLLVFLLAYHVFRMHYWLFHIAVGKMYCVDVDRLSMKKIEEKYEQLMIIPFVEQYLFDRFGDDVGHIIFMYYISIE